MGYKSPSETSLFNPEWGCLLHVFNSFPLIDEGFYGKNISSYKRELGQLEVIVDFEKAMKAFVGVFKQKAGISSIGKGNVISLLTCIRKLSGTAFKFPTSCIRDVKWLRTRLGDYRAPKDCVLFGSDWESIAPISLLPFIDDSVNYYGKEIYEFKKELKNVGVVVAFEKGCKLLPACLRFPSDLSSITPANAYALLECIRLLKAQKDELLSESLLKKIGTNWLKTMFGYKSPNECLLFCSDWNNLLARKDGPFMDEEFYGPNIKSYSKELNMIGVIVEVENGCSLLASHLIFHSETKAIVRIYNYLNKFNWKPEIEEKRNIWVPNQYGGGNWEKTDGCVLWDKDSLFSEKLIVLEKYYDPIPFDFFACTLGVKSHPCLNDYCKLWISWESSGKRLSHKECCAFWQYVVRNWGLETEKFVAENLSKLPVDSGSDGVLLVNKDDVFIADDLLLKNLFQQISHQLFVWFPKQTSASAPRFELLEIYTKIGVRKLTEAVEKEETMITHGGSMKKVNPNEIYIGKGLVSLILGFLAKPSLNMEPQKRQKLVKHLLGVTVFETTEPILVSYNLSLSSGEILATEAKLVICWERERKKIIAKKMDKSHGSKSVIEYATCFSKIISKGLLWEDEMWIEPLAELIKIGLLVDFDEEAIEFLMESKNLELFEEDNKFLSSVFPTP